jgi:hypothetical protein
VNSLRCTSPATTSRAQLRVDVHEDVVVAPGIRRVGFLVMIGLQLQVAGREQDALHLGILPHVQLPSHWSKAVLSGSVRAFPIVVRILNRVQFA